MKANANSKPRILRDTSEKEGKGWQFPESEMWGGTSPANLYTGDYTIEGYFDNKQFVIERKATVSELVSCITHKEKWDDFKQELERLEDFAHPFVVCEFPYVLLTTFPENSGLPRAIADKIRVSPQFLIKRLAEIFVHFKTPFLFVDGPSEARNLASSIFKRVIENVEPDFA